MNSICCAKYPLSSSRKLAFLVLSVEMSSSKYFSDFCSTFSAFSSRVSLACRISRSTLSVFSNFSDPSLAARLILLLKSLAPSQIFETTWPRWASNMRHEGQIMLNGRANTSSIEYSSTRRHDYAGCRLRCPRARPLRELRPFSGVIYFKGYPTNKSKLGADRQKVKVGLLWERKYRKQRIFMLMDVNLFILLRQNQLYRRMGNDYNNQGETTAVATGSSSTIKKQLSSQKENIEVTITSTEKHKMLRKGINDNDVESSEEQDPKSHMQRKNQRILRIVKTIVGGELDFCEEQVLMGVITETSKEYEQRAEKQRKMAEKCASLQDREPEGQEEKTAALRQIVKRNLIKRQQSSADKAGKRHLL